MDKPAKRNLFDDDDDEDDYQPPTQIDMPKVEESAQAMQPVVQPKQEAPQTAKAMFDDDDDDDYVPTGFTQQDY